MREKLGVSLFGFGWGLGLIGLMGLVTQAPIFGVVVGVAFIVAGFSVLQNEKKP